VNDKKIVLIVDDTPENLQVLGNLLEEDYDVRISTNGPEALEMIKLCFPDLILLDIIMPGMGGFEVCRILKRNPDLNMIPIIFISALSDTEHKIQSFQEGAVDYITKPFQAEEVLARVHTHIQLSKMEALKHEINERKIAEANLLESIKVLRVFYTISEITEREEITLTEIYNECVNIIPKGLKYEDNTCSRLRINGSEYFTGNFRETPWKLCANISVFGSTIGQIEVFYLEKSPDSKDITFLNDEKKLINEVANRIGRITERMQSVEEVRKKNKTLEDTLNMLSKTQKQVLQQEKMRSLGQLASGIAHDINNSLTPIMGYIDLLTEDEDLMARHQLSINLIIKSSKNIARTIGRLKDFYRTNIDEENKINIEINTLIDSTIELTRHKWKDIAESTGSIIEIKKEYETNLPPIKADESELTEALTNLILNACDAMPNGGNLTFSTSRKENNIILQIRDTGSGMDESTLEQCLNPFFSTKGKNGTGLGLSMVFSIIQRHNGKLLIESKKNVGTNISIVLPIDIKQKIKIINPNTPLLNKSLKILCVEDEMPINNMLKKMLEIKNHKVFQASNGILGLELFKKSLENNDPFDLVITDLGMPGMDGNSLAKTIKQISSLVPIILLTGWGILKNKEEYPSVDYLMKKPFVREELHQAIDLIFNK
jgi:DNA-binding response OmpR family regulator/signal transduction histidine kinase